MNTPKITMFLAHGSGGCKLVIVTIVEHDFLFAPRRFWVQYCYNADSNSIFMELIPVPGYVNLTSRRRYPDSLMYPTPGLYPCRKRRSNLGWLFLALPFYCVRVA